MNILNILKIVLAILVLTVLLLLYLAHIFSEPEKTESALSSKTGSIQASHSNATSGQQKVTTSAPQTSSNQQKSSPASTQNSGVSGKKQNSQQSSNCTPPSDSSITSTIKMYIATNELVSSSNIDVITTDKVVNLVGSVNSIKEASILIKIAESVENVKDVDISKLTINGNQKLPEDSVITSKAEGIFIREKLFNKDVLKPIRVKTINGNIILNGTVANQMQVDQAIKLIKSIKGVNKIKSEIVIEKNNKE